MKNCANCEDPIQNNQETKCRKCHQPLHKYCIDDESKKCYSCIEKS